MPLLVHLTSCIPSLFLLHTPGKEDSKKVLNTDMTNSKPESGGCSALCKEDGSFAPAHMLADPRLERAGRSLAPDLERRSSELGSHGKLGVTRTAALVGGLLTAACALRTFSHLTS